MLLAHFRRNKTECRAYLIHQPIQREVSMSLWGEFRYAVRSLANSPVFASVAVVSMALGIGANTAVFSMLDHILLNPLPVSHPDELVQLKELGDYYGSNNGMNALSY